MLLKCAIYVVHSTRVVLPSSIIMHGQYTVATISNTHYAEYGYFSASVMPHNSTNFLPSPPSVSIGQMVYLPSLD